MAPQRSASARRTTLADVARHAGVDTSVVSRIVNNDPALNVRSETRERVQESIRTLGYRPNIVARGLRTQQTGTLGLFLPDFANPVYAEIITGAEAKAMERGRVLMTGRSRAEGSQRSAFLDLMGQGRVDGLLLAGEALPAETEQELDRIGLPYLLLNQRGPGSRRFIVLDDERAAGMAVGHLAELGHNRIGHLAGPADSDTAQRRRSGYLQAIRSHGGEVRDDDIYQADYTPSGGYAAMERLLAEPDAPSAVLVANMAAAIGALHACAARGVRVPDEMSIVAIHDSALADYLWPPLTTVKMPLRELGSEAVQLLMSVPANVPIQHVVEGEIELRQRASTAGPGTAGRK